MSEGILRIGRYLGINFTKNELGLKSSMFYCSIFFASRADIGGLSLPIAISLYIAASKREKSKIAIILMITLSLLFSKGPEASLMAVISAIFYEFISGILSKVFGKEWYCVIGGFFAVLLPGMIQNLLIGGMFFDLVAWILKSMSSICFIFLFDTIIEKVFSDKISNVDNDTAAFMSIGLILMLSGIWNVTLLGIHSTDVILIAATLFCSFIWGGGAGCAGGLIAGFLLTGVSPGIGANSFIPSICGAITGMSKVKSRWGACLIYLSSYFLISSYINYSVGFQLNGGAFFISLLLFLFLPKELINLARGLIRYHENDFGEKQGRLNLLKNVLSFKVAMLSQAIGKIGRIVVTADECLATSEKVGIDLMFDNVADRICRNCGLCLHCWEKGFYSTYQAMHVIIEVMEKKGWVDEGDIPGYFIERCERLGEFLRTMNAMYEVYKLNLLWESRLSDGKVAMAKQYDEMSEVLFRLSDEIQNGIYSRGDMEQKLELSLKKVGIKFSDINVLSEGNGYNVNLIFEQSKKSEELSKLIQKTIYEVTNEDMAYTYKEKLVEPIFCCRQYRFYPRPKYSVNIGVAGMAKRKGEASGDSYSFWINDCGWQYIVLSDGEGAGKKASSISKLTVELTENLVGAGFENKMSMKLLNSAILLKRENELTSTLDIAAIELNKPYMESFKQGAVPSFIKRNKSMEVIAAVPFVTDEDSLLNGESIKYELLEGDIIIMFSDGAYEALKGSGSCKTGLHEIIKEYNGKNPQEFADYLLDEAYRNCLRELCDDMTIIVAKIWRRQ